MKEGRGSFLAASRAARRLVRSVLPSLTCCTCQPRASKRAATSSVKEMSVWPSMEILARHDHPHTLMMCAAGRTITSTSSDIDGNHARASGIYACHAL